MIIAKREILGDDVESAAVKPFYFGTNLNGSCEIVFTDFKSKELAEANKYGTNTRINISSKGDNAARLEAINTLIEEMVADHVGGEIC